MRLSTISLKRFKSIRELLLPDPSTGGHLGNLVVLIGRNSSGKSNFLEALDYLFREFDQAFERSIGPVNLELWYGRETTAPIEWAATLDLAPNETLALFGKDLMPLFDGIPDNHVVRLRRLITATPHDMKWQTTDLNIGSIRLIKDTQVLPPDAVVKQLGKPATVTPNLAQSLLTNLTPLLRSQYKYIGCARDNVQQPPSFGNRAPIINPSTLSSINTLAQGIDANIRNKWTPLRAKMETTLPHRERVDSKGGQLFLENEPLAATGGGTQSILGIIHDVETGPQIVAVEEPENHLHPELVKKAFRYFQAITEGTNPRQIFVSTHSPFFLDSSHLPAVVALYWDGTETKAHQIGTKQDLRTALFDIGARPSDVFFSDIVLIVEGESDKIVFQHWARILGVPLEDIHAAVVPAKGVDKTRYHLKLWAEISREITLPTYVIVDQSGKNEVDKVIAAGLIDASNAHVLERGDLEDYYPPEVLATALTELAEKQPTPEQLQEATTVKAIQKILGKDSSEWKVPLAERVSQATKKNQIPREIADFLRRIYNENK